MKTRLTLTALLAALALLVVACGGDDPTDPVNDNSATGDYLKSLPTWDVFCPPLATADVPTDTSAFCLDEIGEERFLCVETPKSLTDTPSDVVTFNAGGGLIWPGALIQGRTTWGGVGTMQELAIRQRAPVTLSIDILRENNTRTVANPDLATVRSAIGELIDAAHQANHVAGNAIHFEKTEAYSMEQLALKLGISVKYMGASVRSKLEYNTTSEQNTVAAYFTQRMFTVNMVTPQTPQAVFSAEFTPEILQEQVDLDRIGPGNLPVYVQQVVYGRMLVMTMTSSRSTSEMLAALDASYAAVEVGAQVDDTSIFEESVFTVAAVGGDAVGIQGLLSSGQLADYFDHASPLTAAVPIAYTLLNLADDSVASVSETTTYIERVCSAVAVNLISQESQWRNAVQGETGDAIYTFVPSRENIGLSLEASAPSSNNINLYTSRLTFLGADTGFPFDFVLTKSTPGDYTHNDEEGSGNCFDSCEFPHLSPGDADNYDDDDIEIIVTRIDPGLAISGIAVNVGHNTLSPEEYLEVFNPGNVLLEIFDHTTALPAADKAYAFMGVASPLPLRRIYFNEDMGGDDICFQNVWISVRTANGEEVVQ